MSNGLEKRQQQLFYNSAMPSQVIGAPYVPRSATSRAAAILAIPRAGTQRRKVLNFLIQQGENGAIDEEIQNALEMVANTQRPRRIELVALKLVTDSGRKRKTKAVRDATIWIATTDAMEIAKSDLEKITGKENSK